jgi:hypothetical protein
MNPWPQEEEEDDSDLPDAEGDDWEDVPETHLSDEDYDAFVDDELSGWEEERTERRVWWILGGLVALLLVVAVLVLA